MDGGHVWVGLAIMFVSTGIHVVMVKTGAGGWQSSCS